MIYIEVILRSEFRNVKKLQVVIPVPTR